MVPNNALQASSSRYESPPSSTSLVDKTGEDQEDGTETQHPAISQNNILPSEEGRLVSPFLCSKQHTRQPEMEKKKKDREAVSQSPAHAPTMTTDSFLCARPVLCLADALHHLPTPRPVRKRKEKKKPAAGASVQSMIAPQPRVRNKRRKEERELLK